MPLVFLARARPGLASTLSGPVSPEGGAAEGAQRRPRCAAASLPHGLFTAWGVGRTRHADSGLPCLGDSGPRARAGVAGAGARARGWAEGGSGQEGAAGWPGKRWGAGPGSRGKIPARRRWRAPPPSEAARKTDLTCWRRDSPGPEECPASYPNPVHQTHTQHPGTITAPQASVSPLQSDR